MKKQFLSFAVLICLFLTSQAQLKIHNSGNFTFGWVPAPQSFNFLTIRSADKRGIWLESNFQAPYNQSMTTRVQNPNTLSYVVHYNGSDNFMVASDGGIFAKGIWVTSDRRLKQNIVPLENALKKVKSLRGVSYSYTDAQENNGRSDQTEIGFVAQELEEVLPEMVRERPDGLKSVNYLHMVGLLVEAIKEQQVQIDLQTTEIEELKSQVTSSTGHLENMEEHGHLEQNIPNPFNESTRIGYYLEESVNEAKILIFDPQGTLITTFPIEEMGEGSIQIDAGDFEAGLYIYSLIADGKEIDHKRMILTEK
ncbi:tail fiber domain-containing protein [bacterium SCSIO 12741]|nr:tail fiber domain-containing protein [bacterium SCSIO 12741]